MCSFFLHEQWYTIELRMLALCRENDAATEMKMVLRTEHSRSKGADNQEGQAEF